MKTTLFGKHIGEAVVRFMDDVDDFIMSTAFRVRRILSRKPRERRKEPRLANTRPKGSSESGENR